MQNISGGATHDVSTVTDKKRQQGKQRNINETVKLQTKHTRQRNKPNTRTHMKMRAHPQTRTQRAHMNQSQRRRPNYYKHTNTKDTLLVLNHKPLISVLEV